MKGWLAPAVVVLLAAAGGFAASQLYLRPAAPSAQLAVERRLLCPQCQEVRLDVCDRQVCTDMKADIARRLARGESEDRIVGDYAAAYGTSILAANQPGGPLAPLLPWLLVAAGLGLLATLAWRARGAPAPPATALPDRGLEAELAAWRTGR